jgi:predicted O-methyltransferase YrrM
MKQRSLLSEFRRAVGVIRRVTARRLPQRHSVDYATHVPILVGVGCSSGIARILEFGAGFYSTLTFLNRAAFPDVTSVSTIESDPDWISKVRAAAKDDPRLTIRYAPEPVESLLPELDLGQYDLILVDSSTDAAKRAALVRELAARSDGTGLVVVHDFEIDLYRWAAKGFANRIEYSEFNPGTGILWHAKRDGVKKTLKSIKRIISRHAKLLPPDDVESWAAAFRKELLFVPQRGR